MFTGLIETMGTVILSGSRFQIRSDTELSMNPGDSLAVSGSCLTVVKTSGRDLFFDVSPETLRRIVRPVRGARVNLERPLSAQGRLHGHFVTGHIDETGKVTKVRRTSGFSEVTFSCSSRNLSLVVEKGSVAVDGISLTVMALTNMGFAVSVIPETLETTTAGKWKPGYGVNVEFDIIGKYVARAADAAGQNRSLREYFEQSGNR